MSIFSFFRKSEKTVKDETPTPASHLVIEPSANTQPEPTQKGPQPQPSQTGAAVAKRVHNLIILDESGSMQSIYQQALTGVNQTLQTIREARKEHEGQKHFVTLITFDSAHYNPIYHNAPVEAAVDITENQYRPGACTPLFDAMGRAINELRPSVKKGDVVLVTVITDGYENASREYDGKAIKRLVEAMKQEGWVFTYIGANQDVEAVAASMSIDNHLAFEATPECTGAMFERERRSRKRFFGKLDMPGVAFSEGYFDEDDENENEEHK